MATLYLVVEAVLWVLVWFGLGAICSLFLEGIVWLGRAIGLPGLFQIDKKGSDSTEEEKIKEAMGYFVGLLVPPVLVVFVLFVSLVFIWELGSAIISFFPNVPRWLAKHWVKRFG